MDTLGKAQEAARRFENTSDLRGAAEHRLTAIMYALVALAEERKFEALWKARAEPSLARRVRLAQELLEMEGEGAVPA